MNSAPLDGPRAICFPRASEQAFHKGVLAAPDRFGGYARAAAVLRGQGQGSLADRALRKALMIAPDEPRLQVNAANLWLSSGIPGDSVGALRRAMCLDPRQTAAIQRLLLIHKATGDSAGAIKAASRLLVASPENRAAGYLELAALMKGAGDHRRARRHLDAGLRETIRLARGSGDLIRAAKRVGDEEDGFRIARSLLCASPTDAIAAQELASAANTDDNADMRLVNPMVPRLCLAHPDDPVLHNGAGVLEERYGRNFQALRRYKMAAVLGPDLSVAIFNVGVRARYAGKFNVARRYFERALTIAPRDPIYRYNLGHVLLATGDTDQGLVLYEERWRSGRRQSHRRAAPDPSFATPVLETDTLPDPRDCVLIWGEQGLGDEIWFAGYAPDLFAANNSLLECDSRLVDLFKRSGLATTIVARTDPPQAAIQDAKWQIAAGSLPYLAMRRSSVPKPSTPRQFLKVDPDRAAGLRDRLADLGAGPTIGVSWRSRKRIQGRSFEAPLECLRPILEIPGAIFVNLQYDAHDQEIRTIDEQFGVKLARFADVDPLRDIDGLAALVSGLDHVVSIANINVALCHGLGRACHVALRAYQEDWRFQRGRSHSDWLPDCHLYWPDQMAAPAAAWEGVFARIAKALNAAASQST